MLAFPREAGDKSFECSDFMQEALSQLRGDRDYAGFAMADLDGEADMQWCIHDAQVPARRRSGRDGNDVAVQGRPRVGHRVGSAMSDNTTRWTNLEQLLDRHSPVDFWHETIEGDCADRLPRWALVQFNGEHAPDEKVIHAFESAEAACAFAAADCEWRPEALADLDAGVEHQLRVEVTFDPAQARPLSEIATTSETGAA